MAKQKPCRRRNDENTGVFYTGAAKNANFLGSAATAFGWRRKVNRISG
jgi:hypothetical protein